MNSDTSKMNQSNNSKDSGVDGIKNEEKPIWEDEKIINWEEEATAIINDVKTHVKEIEIARTLPSSESNIYLNITTIEAQQYCVHVSSAGFRIVSNAYNTIDEDKRTANEDDEEVYETPYALLDRISPRYVESFGNQLINQLLSLQQMRTQFNEEDEDELDENDDHKATFNDDT